MGLDIQFAVDNSQEVFTPEYITNDEFSHSHKLSRTFCNLMCRQHGFSGIPELDQIGKITGLDISPLYQMECFMEDFEIDDELSRFETNEEKENFKKTTLAEMEKNNGNIEIIYELISALIDRLSKINNLPEKLDHAEYDTLNSEIYFSDFNLNPGNGDIDNNFGQDLRNFKNFIEFARSKGSKTIYFRYE